MEENKQNQNNPDQQQEAFQKDFVYSWESEEYINYDRGKKWYIFWAVFLVAVIIFSILYFKNYVMALTFLVIAIVVYIYIKKEPRKIDVNVYKQGIEVDGIFYDYSTLKSFWLFQTETDYHDSYISIKRTKKYLPNLLLPIGKNDWQEITSILEEYIPLKRHEEELSVVLERMLKL
jgi:hypothetical protein